MMKSIAFNDTANPADDEGFVIVDSPQGFSSILEDDEDDDESYDHCDDAFSFSSLHQNLPVSSLPMEAVQDNFFEPPIGQEVLPPAVPSSPSLLSEYDDDDDDDNGSPAFAMGDSSKMKVVIPHIDSDVEGLCALVSSLPSVSESRGAVATWPTNESTPAAVSSAPDSPDLRLDATGSAVHSSDSLSSEYTPGVSSEDDDDINKVTRLIPSSSSTDVDDDDEVANKDDEEEEDVYVAMTETSSSRLSKKKRRKQLKLAKKAAAAAAAAAALGQLTLRSTTPKRKGAKNRKKVANIAVSCAVQSIAEYKEEVERKKILKKIR